MQRTPAVATVQHQRALTIAAEFAFVAVLPTVVALPGGFGHHNHEVRGAGCVRPGPADPDHWGYWRRRRTCTIRLLLDNSRALH